MATTGFRGFDHTIQETNTWLHEITERMGHPYRHLAYHALRGVWSNAQGHFSPRYQGKNSSSA